MKLFDNAKERADNRVFNRRFYKALSALKEYENMTEYETDAFRFVAQNASVVKMRFDEAKKRIMRMEIRPLVFAWAKELTKDGKEHQMRETVLSQIDQFDESAMLTPGEFFSLSSVIIIECAKIFVDALTRTIYIQKAMIEAEQWMEKDARIPADFDPIFFLEHALKLSSEKGDLKKRGEIIDCIHSIGKNEAEIIKVACDEISNLLLRLTNAVSLMHTVIDIDWANAYQKISHIEKTLSQDPSGIYPEMDEESKSAIRREIEVIHRCTHSPQRHIASSALKLSKDEKNGITQIIYTDEGRRKLLNEINADNAKLPKMIPDPKGYGIMTSVIFALIILVIGVSICVSPLFVFFLFPCLFALSEEVVRRISRKCVSTRPLLSLNSDCILDKQRTLVVIPALLATQKSVESALFNLASYGMHEKSENIDFLLLGDFKDSREAEQESDGMIIRDMQKGIDALNAKSTRRKYFFLIRNRTYNQTDQIYMGYERKRGALMALNQLLLGYGNRFMSEASDASMLVNRYRYVLTVDTDTKILPGTIRKMIATIAHPLNDHYAVLQPRMENAGLVKPNLFSSWMAGFGGTDHYDVCASDFYQDLTGEGLFSGKGIYNIQTFYEKTAEAFQENTILSHDMIEGILSKAGYCGNIVMYESFPETIGSFYKRLDRWTRGDWQLIHYLFGRLPLSALGRWKIIGNLLRSLKAASLLTSILLSVWCNHIGLFAALMAFHFLPVLLNGSGAVKPCVLNLMLLPFTAYTEIKAALTALVRLYITKRRRLEWVTAAENEKTGKTINYPGITASILLLPGLFSSSMWLPSAILGLIFAIGKDFVDSFDRLFRSEAMQASDYTYLTDLSRRMWRYFEKHVPLTGSGFPPDNVQIDPPIGEQARTSPTNIGMYLISLVAAGEMGLIEENELITRVKQTLSSIQQLETWNGLPYNWYDIHTLAPSNPKYVSSVDAGNLMAAYVVVRNYFQKNHPSLSNEFDQLIQKMDIEKLYNPRRKLFRIGVDVQNNRLSASHYDLLSSEARILSFTAMAEKGIAVSHWKQLARPFFFHKGKSALYSWSGTMFEYMMPNLLMPSACGSLMRNSMQSAIALQTKKTREGIWGITEAGYAAFDQMLNYQYRAFGIKELALSGEASETVYAPYGVLIALEYAFFKGMDSLKNMQEAGMKGEYGFYEAIDFSKENKPRIVYSYMSHHQGMGFIAICNLLTGNALKKHFLNHPNEQALTPLLNEKPFLTPLYRRIFKKPAREQFKKEEALSGKDEYSRYASSSYPEGHLLFSSNTLAYFESTGRSFIKRDGIYANYFDHDASDQNSSILPEIHDESGKAKIVRCQFDTSCAEYDYRTKIGKYKAVCTINPAGGELLIKVTAKNETDKETEVKIRHAFRLSLNTQDLNYAHIVFSDLFVKTECVKSLGLEHARRNRDTLKYSDFLYHLTDSENGVLNEHGKTHGKYSVLTRKITLSPGDKKEMFFSVSIEKEKRTKFEELNHASFERAKMLLLGQMNAQIQFCGLSASEYRLYDKKTANLFSLKASKGEGALPKSALWPLGLSGEGNILLVKLKSAGDLVSLRKAVRMHKLLRFANLTSTLVILKIRETEYFTPLKDAAMNHLLSGHLADGLGKEGGAMILDAEDLNSQLIRAIESMDVFRDRINPLLSDQKEAACSNSKMISAFDQNALIGYNGYGGFLKNGNAYQINVSDTRKPPRRWSNFLVNDAFGAIVNDLGISSIYYKNSRMGRITAFDNNLDEPKQSIEMEMIYNGRKLSLFPGTSPKGHYTVIHDTGLSTYSVKTEAICSDTTVCVHPYKAILSISVLLENTQDSDMPLTVKACVGFLMGIDDRDLKFTNLYSDEKCTIAYGCAGFAACAGWTGDEAKEGGMQASVLLKPHEKRIISFFVSAADTDMEAKSLFHEANAAETNLLCKTHWQKRMSAITISSGNPLRDKLANGFMKYQTIASRYFARFGPYQPGGAFGMRDQLQDLLSIMYFDKALAKEHILLAASRQFERGDALHWWHIPASGVRTRITDDVLFLALVAVKYAEETGDTQILSQKIPYLKNMEIPEGETELYASFEETDYAETLYEHIMKAFRYSGRKGPHRLLLMGSGDWNDGMNRVRGESVWLAMFYAVTLHHFAQYADEAARAEIEDVRARLLESIERSGWDGSWYLRAFFEDGAPLGSATSPECRIDSLSQSWAVFALGATERTAQAVDQAWQQLFDPRLSLMKLLTPPFDGRLDAGYIGGYLPGIRENGGQYTHAAAWMVWALCELGWIDRAWALVRALNPIHHGDSSERYRLEPYALAGDVYSHPQQLGRGGWSFYTGSAAWLYTIVLEKLLGFEKRGDQVRLRPMVPPEWDGFTLTLQWGSSTWHFHAGRDEPAFTCDGQRVDGGWVTLQDDGRIHQVRTPLR